jgi:ribose transport system substrate-binding protein
MHSTRWRIAALAAVGVAALAACSSSGSGGSDNQGSTGGTVAGPSTPAPEGTGAVTVDYSKLSLAYASAGDQIGIFKTVGDGVVDYATQLGIKIKRYDNNTDGPTALNNAGLIVQEKPGVAIDWNTVVGVGAAVGARYKRAKIPCLAVNQQIPGCAWFNLSNKQVGLDSASIILPVAEQRGWTGANTTVVMVIAAANGTEVNDGPRYFYVETAKKLDGFKQVTPESITASTTTIGGTNGVQIDCKGTVDGAFSAMRNVIGSIPKSNNILLFGTDDDCTMGAYRSLKQGGYGSRVLTGGLGAAPDGIEALKNDPNWLSEGALFIQNWGAYVLAEAVAISQGVTPPPLTSAPQVTLSKETLSKYYNEDGSVKLLPPLVDNNKYLAKYGILQKFLKVEGLS